MKTLKEDIEKANKLDALGQEEALEKTLNKISNKFEKSTHNLMKKSYVLRSKLNRQLGL